MGLDKWAIKGKNTLIKLIGLFYVLEGAADIYRRYPV